MFTAGKDTVQRVSPAIPELPERLSDGQVELRLAAEWDIPDILIAHQDDRELHRSLGLARPPSGADLGSASEREPAERAAGTGVKLTIVAPGSEDCRGRVEAREIDWEQGSAALSVWVAPALRNQGIARRALALAAGWLLTGVGLKRLTLTVAPGNEAMLRAATAAGFEREDGAAAGVVLVLGAD